MSINQQPNKIRIHKWLSDMGVASRRQAEKWIKEGLVIINGKVIDELGLKIDPINDSVFIKNKNITALKPPPKVYWMLNKPVNYLSSRSSNDSKKTIYDLPALKKLPFLVYNVGRLDYKTEGLLLMTNDGNLAYRLTHPKFKVPRFYKVLFSAKLTKEQEDQIRSGVKLEDGITLPIKLRYKKKGPLNSKKPTYWYDVIVMEGRNRLVRRVFDSVKEGDIIRLIRTGFGPLRLSSTLESGTYRQLLSKEIKLLKSNTFDK